MADQRAINKAGHRFRTGLELAPEFFAQIAGALFGVLSGFGLLLGAFVADIKSLQSTAGRRQIVYGRQGHKPVAFEGRLQLVNSLQSSHLASIQSVIPLH